MDIKRYKEVAGDLIQKQSENENREKEYELLLNHLQLELKDKQIHIDAITQERDEKQTEIDQFDSHLMKLKDDKLDFESQIDNRSTDLKNTKD